MGNPVSEWLADGKWFVGGLMLLRDLGGDVSDFEKYAAGGFVPPYYKEVLEMRLRALQHAAPGILAAKESGESAASETEKAARAEEPEWIAGLRERAKYLHKQEAMRHAEMRVSGEREVRYACASEIMRDIRPKLDTIYDAIRHWEATGEVPMGEKAAQAAEEQSSDFQKRLNLRSRVSRIKTLLKGSTLSEKRRKGLEWELEEKEVLLKTVNERLNG
jgi:hypothetical protein